MAAQGNVSALDDHLGYWLRALSNHVSHSFARKVEGKGVTVAEWVVLRALYQQPAMLPSRLADTIGMTRGAITKLADRLIAKRLLNRAASADDGRAQTLALSKKGAALVPDLAALADQNDAECFAHLTAKERAVLDAMLKKSARHFGFKTAPID